jgi:chaperone modulatory protein CbpM
MHYDFRAATWLDHWQRLSIGELAIFSGLAEAQLHELVDYGVLKPTDPQAARWAFSADCVTRVKQARRMRDDLELDTHGMALAIMLLDRIDELETRLAACHARIPHWSA